MEPRTLRFRNQPFWDAWNEEYEARELALTLERVKRIDALFITDRDPGDECDRKGIGMDEPEQ